MLCAGVLSSSSVSEDGRDACYGDSGSPLMRNVDGAWELVGLTSWGFACASSKTYGVYTRVSKFGEWLSNPPPIPPFSISPPEVRGLPMVGERLRCTPPAWNGDPRTGQIIEWIDDATGEVIFSGRTDIKLRRLDTGRSIRCDVTAKNGGGDRKSVV